MDEQAPPAELGRIEAILAAVAVAGGPVAAALAAAWLVSRTRRR